MSDLPLESSGPGPKPPIPPKPRRPPPKSSSNSGSSDSPPERPGPKLRSQTRREMQREMHRQRKLELLKAQGHKVSDIGSEVQRAKGGLLAKCVLADKRPLVKVLEEDAHEKRQLGTTSILQNAVAESQRKTENVKRQEKEESRQKRLRLFQEQAQKSSRSKSGKGRKRK